MVTSDSPEDSGCWSAEAAVFSGRPNPAWKVRPETARQLTAIWDALEKSKRAAPAPPALGWRGVVLTAPDGRRWIACSGTVTADQHGETEARSDEKGNFLRALVASAPDGLIPEGAVPG